MRTPSAGSPVVDDNGDHWSLRNNGQSPERTRHAGHRTQDARDQFNGFQDVAADHARAAVTWLLVAGTRHGSFQQAAGSGADAIVIDLDRFTTPADKAEARRAAIRYLSAGRPAYVQVNRPRSVSLAGDLAALSEAGQALRGVILPQAERPEQFRLLDDLLPPGAIVIPLIESPRGLLAAHEIACAPRVARLGFLPARLAAGTRIQDQHYGLLVARSLLVLTGWADTLAGPIDGASMPADDLVRVTMDAEASRRIGFTGKFCTSARQVAPVAFGFCSANG